MKKRVLLIDGNRPARESLKNRLESAGYIVLVAAGGLEAVIRFEQTQVELVILDSELPNQNGWELFERLNTRQPLIPIIVMDGQPHESAADLRMRAGALLAKPIELDALLQSIEQLVAEPLGVRLERLCSASRELA